MYNYFVGSDQTVREPFDLDRQCQSSIVGDANKQFFDTKDWISNSIECVKLTLEGVRRSIIIVEANKGLISVMTSVNCHVVKYNTLCTCTIIDEYYRTIYKTNKIQ